MFVASDGYILDIKGPYFSNDANILVNALNNDVDGMVEWFRNGDIFIVNRCYRDATATLERLGTSFKMRSLRT